MKGSERPWVDFFEARKTKDVLKKIESEPSNLTAPKLSQQLKSVLNRICHSLGSFFRRHI
jgi:hypothetical protein